MIMVWNEKGETHIRVEDDGDGISEAGIENLLVQDASSTGLRNINGRLKLKFGTELKINNRDERGTRVEFVVPRRPKANSQLHN
jgi:sensor histidine kinase YesM